MAERHDALKAVSDAVLGIAGDLSLDAVLERLTEAAKDLVGARYAALGVPEDEGDGFDRFIHTGMSQDEVDALGPLPRTHGLLGAMLTDPEPFRSVDIRTDPRFRGWWPASHPQMRSFLGVPIVFKGDVIGAFYLTDKEGAAEFSDTDEELVGVLAAHAAVLMEHARLYEQSRELSVADERNRLARDLHDAMTQTLFSLRLTIETAASAVATDPDRALRELATAGGLVNSVFTELRALVFELRPAVLESEGLLAAVRKHLDVAGRAHGLDTALNANGDERLPLDMERQLLRITQEAVNNAVRHAGASKVSVDVAFDPDIVVLTVADDGSGFDPRARRIRTRRLGLTSMRERARELGGRMDLDTAPGQGTTVRVEVPRA